MPSLFTTFANFALELLFPQRCAVCGEEARSVVCQGCDPAESVLESDKLLGGVRCHSCGEPTEREGTCAQCLLFPLPMRRLASVWRYTEPVEAVVKALKYRERLMLAPFIAHHLADAARHLRREEPDLFWNLVIPVSSAAHTTRARGFCHTALIARELGRLLGLRVELFLLRSTKKRVQQTSLPLEARAQNVRGAFTASHVTGCSILLIDDVLTTGSTLRAATTALLKGGATAVDALTLARSPHFTRNRSKNS